MRELCPCVSIAHLELELLLLLRRHRVGLGDDRHDVDVLVQPAHEGEVDVLEPVRRDEVEAAVDHPVVVHEAVGLAPRDLVLRLQVRLEEPLHLGGARETSSTLGAA